MPLAPRIPTIYYLPKVHKSLTKPPGRLIVSGIDSVTSPIGKYVDFFLQPMVQETPAFLKDTVQCIRELTQLEIDGDILIVTADVASLYTIIPHEMGYETVSTFLDQNYKIPLK